MITDKRHGDTDEFPNMAPPAEDCWPESGSTGVRVDLAALSHQGHVRSSNEDHYLVLRFGRFLETLLTSLPVDQLPGQAEEVGYALFVADGIGGHVGGEVASRMALSTLVSLVLHTPDWIISNEPHETEQVMQRFADRYHRIQAALRERGRADPSVAGMGTTMTLACSLGATVILGHIGDSRAYLLRSGRLWQLTRDHTLVQALVEGGQLTPDQAARHPWRHVLTRSLSSGGRDVSGDFQRAGLADGDQLLLCTDGLTDMVDEGAILAVLQGAASADEACRALVAAALDKGGKDNVTVALARYRFPQ
jgi:protein phosphatase